MNFREQAPANLGTPTTEADPAAALFNSTYVFGERTYAIEEDPGPAAPLAGAALSDEEPINLTLPAEQTPTPAAMGGPAPKNANEKWFAWPSAQSTLVVSLPNGSDVRSLWLPIVPFPIQVSPGQAPGNVMYTLSQSGSETVPVPAGAPAVALTAIAQGQWSGIYVFASGEKHAGSKSSTVGYFGAASSYDATIIANPLLLNYWPLNDVAGTTLCADYGPTPNPMEALGDMVLGSAGFLYDDETCAFATGDAGCYLTPQSVLSVGRGPQTICFWVFPLASNATIFDGAGAIGLYTNGSNQLIVNASNAQNITNIIVTPNALHFFALVINSSVLDVYLDGNMVFTASYIVNNAWVSFLGNYSSGGNQMRAKIEKIANFSGAFSLSQVRSLYALGIAP